MPRCDSKESMETDRHFPSGRQSHRELAAAMEWICPSEEDVATVLYDSGLGE